MNYLQLGQDLHREGRYAGVAPTTLQSGSGQTLDIASWIADAWNDIQRMYDGRWLWLWRTATLNTVASTSEYDYTLFTDTTESAAIDRFNAWEIMDRYNPPKMYITADGVSTERYLSYLPWENFKALFMLGTQNPGMPGYITIDPADNIVLGPTPNDVYTVTVDYWRGPQTLSADADIPECPAQFHKAIVYEALAKYGYASVAQELIMRANVEGTKVLNALTKNKSASRRRFRLSKAMA